MELVERQWEKIRATADWIETAHPRRDVADAIRYVNDNGCKWRSVPVDFGFPWRTVFGFFRRWRANGVLASIHTALHERVRLHDGINPRTVTVILDSRDMPACR